MLLIQMAGLSGAGKTSIAEIAKSYLEKSGYKVEVLDGDKYRKHLCNDLGFSKKDRIENIRRMGIVGLLLAKHNIITILSAINPYEESRKMLHEKSTIVKTVFIDCPVDVAKKRDTKGLYKRAQLSQDHPDYIQHFTGISDPFEIPSAPDLIIKTDIDTPEQSAQYLVDFILKSIHNV